MQEQKKKSGSKKICVRKHKNKNLLQGYKKVIEDDQSQVEKMRVQDLQQFLDKFTEGQQGLMQ